MGKVAIVGGGLAGSEAALALSDHGIDVRLYEMRPIVQTPVHETDSFAELVCSNSLKSKKRESAAGLLKEELHSLKSHLYEMALDASVPAGGALAVDRKAFSEAVTNEINSRKNIEVVRGEVSSVQEACEGVDAVILATGPLTSGSLFESISNLIGKEALAFYDAAAPIVSADSLDMSTLFRQNRYETESNEQGDYLNAAMDRECYEAFINELTNADRVILKKFETDELFNACQPIEEIARKGLDAPRYGPMKPVGIIDPATSKRPWATVQLRAEDKNGSSYNLVGFQTNLTFPEQRRVFRMIPGLENAEFTRYGVMHRNTFIDAPNVIDESGKIRDGSSKNIHVPIFICGQLSGTEGYCEAIRSGINAAISTYCHLEGMSVPALPSNSVFGALMKHATDPQTKDYQPMHVNFGIMEPLPNRIKSKSERYRQYADRAEAAMDDYVERLESVGYL